MPIIDKYSLGEVWTKMQESNDSIYVVAGKITEITNDPNWELLLLITLLTVIVPFAFWYISKKSLIVLFVCWIMGYYMFFSMQKWAHKHTETFSVELNKKM